MSHSNESLCWFLNSVSTEGNKQHYGMCSVDLTAASQLFNSLPISPSIWLSSHKILFFPLISPLLINMLCIGVFITHDKVSLSPFIHGLLVFQQFWVFSILFCLHGRFKLCFWVRTLYLWWNSCFIRAGRLLEKWRKTEERKRELGGKKMELQLPILFFHSLMNTTTYSPFIGPISYFSEKS